MPTAEQWNELMEMLSEHRAKWMIWEGEPLPEIVDKLEKRGLRSAVFDPCGNTPEKGDFLSVMGANVESLGRVFAQ